ncbi:MAG: helix-hairpin-helix domain-containing protein [Clostridium sp.]|nr:helix-hairpin-helix domain-containing protein [Clostridium sp.]
MKKKYTAVGIITIVVMVSFYALFTYVKSGKDQLKKNETESMFVEEDEGEAIELKNKQIVVDVKGGVKRPNIYRLDEGSIVEDAIKIAGGTTSEADLIKINRAEKLSDNQEIPIKGQDESESFVSSASSSSGKVNINTANETELDSLPGIGPAKAVEIIKYREENGKFKSIEEIKNIKGIGEASFEKLKDSIKV